MPAAQVDRAFRPALWRGVVLAPSSVKTILRRFVDGGGSVVLSSHVMALVEQLCDTVAVLANGTVAVAGPLSRVRDGRSLEETFVQLVGPGAAVLEGLSWLAS